MVSAVVLLLMVGVVFAVLALPGYQMLATGSNPQVARGVLLLIGVGVAASWVLNHLSFDAG